MKCHECGQEMKSRPPLSAMGEQMYGRGVDIEYCDNPRCKKFGWDGGGM